MNQELRAASEMKDSGVEWIGDIPSGWRITKLKNALTINFGQSPEGELNLEGNGVPFYQGKADFGERYPTPSVWCNNPKKIAEKNDILISVRAPVGELNICQKTAGIGRGIAALGSLTYNFYYYILIAAKGEMEKLSNGSTFDAIGYRELSGIKLPNPENKEKEQISKFLDSETSKIQKLIETKTKQIQLLQEYEKSLIHHAVTKGLDSKAKMKDSGVEWIGEMPDTWTTKRFKYVCDYEKGKSPDGFLDNASINTQPYLEMEYLRGQSEPKYTILSENSVMVNDGDILLLWDGSKAGEFVIGKKGILSSTMAKIIEKKKKPLLKYLLKSFESVLIDLTNGMGIPHVRSEILMNIRVPVVPDDEDKQIMVYLDSETSKIHQTINTIETQIIKLEEYKKSLIYQVVTGKVKVS